MFPQPADPARPTPIFDEVDRWARDTATDGSMLSFGAAPGPTAEPTPPTARTVLALLAAAREERVARHALRRT